MDTDKTGGRNPLVDAAMEIDIFSGKGEPSDLDKLRGEKVADRVEDDPRLQVKPVAADPDAGVEASNPPASYEAMIRLFTGGIGKPAIPGMDKQVNGSG